MFTLRLRSALLGKWSLFLQVAQSRSDKANENTTKDATRQNRSDPQRPENKHVELTERLRQGVNLNENLHERTQKVLNSHPMSSIDAQHDHKAQASRPGASSGSSGSAGPSLSCDRNLPTPQSSVIWWATTLAMVIGYLIFPRYRRKLDAEANRQREAFDASCD